MAKEFDPNAKDEMKKGVDSEESRFKEEIPNGYIPMELSTQGLAGAPKRFHTRNFDTSDLLNLALSEDEELPEKVAKMLDNLILEKDVSVMNFHEKEVVEYLVRLYQAYYSNNLKDVDFPWGKEDIEQLKARLGGENSSEFQSSYSDLKSGKWSPKVDIDLSTVNTYDIEPDTFKTSIYLTDKKTGFKAGFSFPRYGDVVVLRNFMLKQFRDQDKRFSQIKEILKFKRDAEERVRQGENIHLQNIPHVAQAEKDAYKEYETEKSLFGVVAIKALHLIYIDGKDVSNMPLIERMELAKDPRLDFKMMSKVNKYYEGLQLGLEPEVPMINPFTQALEKRRYSFRLVDLLQAIKLYESDEYDIDFESPHVE